MPGSLPYFGFIKLPYMSCFTAKKLDKIRHVTHKSIMGKQKNKIKAYEQY
jgi:hypothetical protein